MLKRSIHQENVVIINLFAPNVGDPGFIKQTSIDLKGTIASI
jgi:hypothetical protein